jgi:hypothetical protein
MKGRGQTSQYALAALALCLAGVPARGQEAAQFGEDKIAELFAQAKPHLEAVLGGPLPRPPRFQVVTAEQMARLPDPDLLACLRWQFPDIKPADLPRAFHVARHVASTAAVAGLDEGSEVINVVPGNLPAIAGWDSSLAQVNSPAFLQLALVHEAARLVLDQRYDLGQRRARCADAEAFLAFQAVVEGRCQWVTRQVARKLGSEGLFPLLAQRYLRVPDVAPDPGLRTLSQLPLRQVCWARTHGLAFFTHLEEKGLPEAEKRAFTRPPRLARWVERPELYVRSERSDHRELPAALRQALGEALPVGEWELLQQPWTPMMVRQVGALMGERARAERAVATWYEGCSLVWTPRKGPRHHVALSVARHESGTGARTYFGFAVDLQRKQDALDDKSCGPPIRVIESKATSVKLPGVEEAVRFDKRMQYGAGSEPIPVSTLLARVGDLVIDISWHGLPADVAWAERVLPAALAAAGK